MAWMELDKTLKKLANFVKVFLRILKKIAINWFIVCSSLMKSVSIFLPVLYEQFHVREKVLC